MAQPSDDSCPRADRCECRSIDRLSAVDSGSTARAIRTNGRAVPMGDKSRQTWRRRAVNIPSFFIEKPDSAKHPFALRFNQLSNDRQNFGSGAPAKINFRMLSTDSPENRPDSFCGGSTLDRARAEQDWVEVPAPMALSTLISCEESAISRPFFVPDLCKLNCEPATWQMICDLHQGQTGRPGT